MSVGVCKRVMLTARKVLMGSGIDPEDPELGIPLRGMAYRAMTDVSADAQCSGLGSREKAEMARDIVVRFYSEVARARGGNRPDTDVDFGDPFRAAGDPFRAGTRDGGPLDGGPTPRSMADPVGGGPLGYPGVVTRRQCRKRLVSRYLLANGYDRDWTLNPSRYSWTAKISAGDSPFVDVRSLAATCLIVPREVYDEQSNAGYTFVPKTNYRHAHGLPFPYLILNLAGFQNLYKSTSAASSKAFAHFVFHSFYSSPNGRDYIRLEPVQCERLTFDINPLSQLSQLEISVQQPSGALLNGSRDDLRVRRIVYADGTATFNQDRRRLLVELASHFDKNEFFRNDTVRFSGFFVPGPAGNAVNAFVNRPEGHRIVDMLVGTHADDMVDGFYVQVMGDYDPATGEFETDGPAIAALQEFNDALDDAAAAKAAGSPPATVPYFDYLADEVDDQGAAVVRTRNHVADGRVVLGDLGRVINASLQCTVSFRVEVEEDDVSTVGAPPLAGEGSFSAAAGPPQSRPGPVP